METVVDHSNDHFSGDRPADEAPTRSEVYEACEDHDCDNCSAALNCSRGESRRKVLLWLFCYNCYSTDRCVGMENDSECREAFQACLKRLEEH